MRATYAVKWREPDGHTYVGRLAFGTEALRLEGRAPDGPVVDREIAYDLVRAVRYGHHGGDRLNGRPALVVDRVDGANLIISAVMGPGILQELADRLSDDCLMAGDATAQAQ